jgi:hypothetical protein
MGDFVFQVSQNGIVLEQVREGRRSGQIIDRDKVNFGVAERGAKHITSDAAEAVDTYFYCHVRELLENAEDMSSAGTHDLRDRGLWLEAIKLGLGAQCARHQERPGSARQPQIDLKRFAALWGVCYKRV